MENRVLVVEKDEIQAALVKRLLERYDMQVDVVRDYTAAMEAYCANDYEYLFFDTVASEAPVDVLLSLSNYCKMREPEMVAMGGLEHLRPVIESKVAHHFLVKPILEADVAAVLGRQMAEDSIVHVDDNQVVNLDRQQTVEELFQEEHDQLIKLFERNGVQKLRRVKASLQFSNIPEALRAVYELKAAAYAVGADRLGNTLGKLDKAIRAGDTSHCNEIFLEASREQTLALGAITKTSIH